MARQTPLTCSGHTRPVVDLQFSSITPDGFFLISACKDGKPMLRNGQTGDWIGTFEGHKGAVWCCALNADASTAVTGSADYSAKVWNAATGDELATLPHMHIVRAIAIDQETRRVATGSMEKLVRVFDLQQSQEPQVLAGHTAAIKKVIWGTAPHVLLSAGDDKVLREWDLRSGEVGRMVALKADVSDLQLSADGRLLTLTAGSTVAFYDPATLQLVKSLQTEHDAHSAALHPDSTHCVVGGEDFYLHVYDFETMKEIDSYSGHHGPVHRVRYAPDGMLYASGSEDGTVRLWQHTVGVEYGLWQFAKTTDDANGA